MFLYRISASIQLVAAVRDQPFILSIVGMTCADKPCVNVSGHVVCYDAVKTGCTSVNDSDPLCGYFCSCPAHFTGTPPP